MEKFARGAKKHGDCDTDGTDKAGVPGRLYRLIREISEIGGFSVVLGLGRNDKRFGRKAIDVGLIQC